MCVIMTWMMMRMVMMMVAILIANVYSSPMFLNIDHHT